MKRKQRSLGLYKKQWAAIIDIAAWRDIPVSDWLREKILKGLKNDQTAMKKENDQ